MSPTPASPTDRRNPPSDELTDDVRVVTSEQLRIIAAFLLWYRTNADYAVAMMGAFVDEGHTSAADLVGAANALSHAIEVDPFINLDDLLNPRLRNSP